jgi:uncharacterized BrkB/YihY/UPF0761 family membrane protein
LIPTAVSKLVPGIVAMGVVAPAFATTQCPPEFGKKSDGFMMIGWSLLFLALATGIALMYFVIKRSRNWKLWQRLPALLLGAIAMLAVWIGGLAVFLSLFAFAC